MTRIVGCHCFVDIWRNKEIYVNNLRRKSIKNHLNRITEKGVTSSKNFWNFVKPFLRNKGFIHSTDITLKLDNEIQGKQNTCIWINCIDINTYLSQNRKQRVRINSPHTILKALFQECLRGSIAGSMLFKLSINNLIYIIGKASMFRWWHFVCLFQNYRRPFHILQSESWKIIKWLNEKKMIS